eukprot:NODE_2386_length_2223_cov_3.762405.p1 GENE.NODE_2386_length_2223_cov_3.762405~~NODE_2386_length_2223_cov_3.762405.p1  ORF type:complete len:662 (+),score=199.56 NODE_2386_length_2223_cov_3.762405:85-2070(+)
MQSLLDSYSYNLRRYTFDQSQRQRTLYQRQKNRVKEWHLFREDARDLFALTTSNMHTYMVVGMLFSGQSIGMVRHLTKHLGAALSWPALFWAAEMASSISMGVLGLWLAVHGNISAHSTSIKVLTQAVRPNIADTSEIQAGVGDIKHFESTGVSTLSYVPAWMTPEGFSIRGVSTAGNTQPPVGATGAAATSGAAAVAAAVSTTPPVTLDRQNDENPGGTSMQKEHVELFRQLQANYVSFDAYARICISRCVVHWLFANAYYAQTHLIAEHYPPKSSMCLGAWICTGLLSFVALALCKLDLYISRSEMLALKWLTLAPPALIAAATTLWAVNRYHHYEHYELAVPMGVPWALAILAAIGHMCWLLLLLRAATPLDDGMGTPLPTSYRTVRFLDVFGFLGSPSGAQPGASEEYAVPSSVVAWLTAPDVKQLLTPEALLSLAQLGESLAAVRPPHEMPREPPAPVEIAREPLPRRTLQFRARAVELCGGALGGDWAALAATRQGSIVALCPRGGELRPAYTIAQVPRAASAELLGLHVGSAGELWLVSRNRSDDTAELHGWNARGMAVGVWQLPSGDGAHHHTWLPGLCGAANGLLALAADESVEEPQLWHLAPVLAGFFAEQPRGREERKSVELGLDALEAPALWHFPLAAPLANAEGAPLL